MRNCWIKGLPIVFFDRVPKKVDTHKIVADNFGGSYQATEHLIKTGKRKIAHITSPIYLSITMERLAGYRKALEDNGIPFDESYVKYCHHGGMVVSENEAAVQELLDMDEVSGCDFYSQRQDHNGLSCLFYTENISGFLTKLPLSDLRILVLLNY